MNYSEDQLRVIIDTIPTLVCSTRPDGSAEFFNQHWLEHTGLSAEQALGWGWKVAIHPDDLPRILEIFPDALNLSGPFDVRGRFCRFDGEFSWFLFRGSPLLDRSGRVVRWYGTNTDLEERKRADAARHVTTGNPYKELVAGLRNRGVQIELCGATAQENHWVNADLLPRVRSTPAQWRS